MGPQENEGEKKGRAAFEEFQLYYESTERVTERRLSGNRYNYTVCTAIVVAIAVVTQWTLTHLNFFALGAGIVVVFCSLGIMFCSMWLSQIKQYKMLNTVKFRVLNDMANHIAFGPSSEDDRVSYLPLDKEWRALIEESEHRLYYRSFFLQPSNAELLIPKIFQALFLLAIILVVVGVIINWEVFVSSLSFKITVGKQ